MEPLLQKLVQWCTILLVVLILMQLLQVIMVKQLLAAPAKREIQYMCGRKEIKFLVVGIPLWQGRLKREAFQTLFGTHGVFLCWRIAKTFITIDCNMMDNKTKTTKNTKTCLCLIQDPCFPLVLLSLITTKNTMNQKMSSRHRSLWYTPIGKNHRRHANRSRNKHHPNLSK